MSLTQKVGWLTVSNFLSQGIGLIVSIIIARTLTRGDYGTYQQVFLFDLFASQFLISGIAGSALYFFSKTQQEQRLQYITNTIYLLGASGLLISLLTYFAAGAVAHLIKNPGVEGLLHLYAFKPVAAYLASIFGPLMITENKVKEIVKAGILFSFVGSASYAIALWLSPTPKVLIIVNIVLGWMNLGYIIWRCRGILWQLPIRFSMEAFKLQRGYIGAMLIQTGAGKIAYDVDKATVTYFMSPPQYAIYVVGAREIPFLQSFTGSVNSLLIPEISRLWEAGRKSEILTLWRRAVSKTALLYIPIFIFLIVYAKPFITLLYSQKYAASVILFQIYLLLLPLRSATYGLIFQAIGHMKPIVHAVWIFFVFNVIANVVLIKILGLPGPALATVLGTYIVAVYYIFHLCSLFTTAALDLFPFALIGRIFLFTLPAIIFSVILSYVWLDKAPELVRLLSAGCVFVIIYVLTAVRFDYNARDFAVKFLNRLGIHHERN